MVKWAFRLQDATGELCWIPVDQVQEVVVQGDTITINGNMAPLASFAVRNMVQDLKDMQESLTWAKQNELDAQRITGAL